MNKSIKTSDPKNNNDNLSYQLTENTDSMGGFEISFRHLEQILMKLSANLEVAHNGPLFVSTSLEFARVCFVVGKGFEQLAGYLQDALHASERMGDRRSIAMIKLHLGRLFYFSEQREKAIQCFSEGQLEVQSLGDEDISVQAAELIGLFYFIQGYFQDAKVYFEEATQSFEFGEYGHSGPMWLSYCHAFSGQYNRAIGTVDYYRRLAHERGNKPLATTLRSVLGIFLARIRKLNEATYHLSGAFQDALQEKNDFATYFAKGGLAFHHMMEGRIEDSKEWLESAVAFGAKLGLVKQYASPFVLEMIFEYHRNGLTPIPDFSFESEVKRILQEPNIHLQAVALRLMAVEGISNGEEMGIVRSKLQQSEKYLKLSGDPVQLGKTRIEMARLNLEQGNQNQARIYAQKAWKGFSGYGDIFYPDDLRHLLTLKDDGDNSYLYQDTLLQRFTAMIEDLGSSDNLNKLLTQTVKATNRFLGAERGGIFLFNDNKNKKPPELIAPHNISNSDISDSMFRPSLELIFKAFHENKPGIKHYQPIETTTGRVKAMIAIPFEVTGLSRGILYHDNAYINDCFNHFSADELTGMATSLSRYTNHLINLTRRIEKKASSNYKRLGEAADQKIIADSPIMKKLLKQADKIAATDSTVLLLGKTGVGKELMARYIHDYSLRKSHPLVIVDPTTIPETLFESELFGHEKGSFTGADSQKTGRIELAHKGTLFIDEVGEIPLSIQVKLLRTLQEKTIVRVGGIKSIRSDFRLIAATNRNLKKEVEKGNFREDLFYRLNVIPIELPPLSKRGEDILLLSQYFVKKYGIKYQQTAIELSQDNKKSLMSYDWPGNIRELKNIIERAVLLAEDGKLELDLKTDSKSFKPDKLFQDRPTLNEIQRQYINLILEETKGKVGGPKGAAERLGMKRTSLYARMRTLGMRA